MMSAWGTPAATAACSATATLFFASANAAASEPEAPSVRTSPRAARIACSAASFVASAPLPVFWGAAISALRASASPRRLFPPDLLLLLLFALLMLLLFALLLLLLLLLLFLRSRS